MNIEIFSLHTGWRRNYTEFFEKFQRRIIRVYTQSQTLDESITFIRRATTASNKIQHSAGLRNILPLFAKINAIEGKGEIILIYI